MENRYNLFPFATENLAFPSGQELEERLNSDSLFLNPQLGLQKSGKPHLRLDDSGLQQMVDSMFSRTERYDKFMQVAGYFDKYNPNEGRLPDLLRENIRQNMLQPFGSGLGFEHEVELFGMLQVSAETKKFLDYSLSYINRNHSTRTSTEFLFFVDELAAGNLNALAGLFDKKVR